MRWLLGMVVVLLVGAVTWTVPGHGKVAALRSLADPIATAGAAPALPWQPGRPQLGVQVYWQDNPADTPEVLRIKADRVFDHVVGLEANAVSLSFPFFTDTITASEVHTDLRTPPTDRLGIVIDEARRSGLRVSVRPLLDEANLIAHDSKDWRGKLDPADRGAWFASYQRFITPYLDLAQQHHAQTFVLASELGEMQTDPRWPALATFAHTRFTGEVSYSANWDAVPSAKAGIPTDVVSVDAYPQLGLHADATQAQMVAAWRTWLRATVTWRPAMLSEVGAAAETRTLDDPAIPNTPGTPLDQGVQARWFGAACQAAREVGLDGLYWWKLAFDDNPAHADPVGAPHDSFLGRSAETTMRQCFAQWSGRE